MLEMVNTMFAEKEKKTFISVVQSILLSNDTIICGLEQLADNIKGRIILGIQNLNGFSLAIYKTGNSVRIYVRYIYGKCIRDKLMNLVHLLGIHADRMCMMLS